MEWWAEKYEPDTAAGRYFSTVLVRTPDDAPDADPRELAFGELSDRASLRARRGRFFLYETSF